MINYKKGVKLFMNSMPKIKEVRVIPVAGYDSMLMTLSGVHAPYFTRNIVIIEDSTGNIGVGEVHGGPEIERVLVEFNKILIGRSIFEYRKILDDINNTKKRISSEGIQNFDISKIIDVIRPEVAIESALLDLMGKFLNMPVCSLLGDGKQRSEVEVLGYLFYVNDIEKVSQPYKSEKNSKIPWFKQRREVALTPESIVEQAQSINEHYGIKNFKLKGGVLEGEKEIETIKMLKKAFPDSNLSIDPNGAWSLKEAVDLINIIKDIITYVEDPCGSEEGYSGREILSEFKSCTGVKVATNMITTNWRQFLPSIMLKSIDIVLADPNFWLMSGSVIVSQLLEKWRMNWGCHSNNHFDISLAMFAHCAASAKGEIMPMDTHWIWQDGQNLCKDSHEIVGGKIFVDDKPGLGVNIDMDRIIDANNLYKKIKNKYGNRDDSVVMQEIINNWRFDPKTPALVR